MITESEIRKLYEFKLKRLERAEEAYKHNPCEATNALLSCRESECCILEQVLEIGK